MEFSKVMKANFLLCLQRNSIQAASNFVSRNHLPPRLKEQILAYMCLRFRAESLNQQQLMDQLPKSICKSICERLFMPIVKDVYLFKGISREMLLLLVRFFPPSLIYICCKWICISNGGWVCV